ncbi:caspase family protein [Pseudomonas chlororaphis]|uniref:Caspase family protein n=1 Tax=Pseudomonas chlororaphis subsp. aurantiaca TaxID=86192 RepID=A0AAJ0ZFN9_9PSED|nr:caspase family protein [Pseudomonas chlororaphis]MBU4631494.1 caspase family protein [Pseudomonas chlororaphis subsp. aurantiaca]
MNIAILIGISKYTSLKPLPACFFDVENMRRMLVATQKYDDIQLISETTSASQVKDALRNFFAKHQDSGEIEEAFIYFSGHGVYQNDALLCCTDFDSSRPATTSISNSELDDLLRSVNPSVAVKVIDACQSGSPYIKDANIGFEKSLGKSQLNSFICMASSQQDQSSYASASESFFTANWIDAASSKTDGQILYRDIQAALADAFVHDPDQTPFFINQGTGLEIFSKVTEEIKAFSASRAKSASPEKPEADIASLIEKEIASRDRQFVPHNDAIEASNASKSNLILQKIADPIVAKFYDLAFKTDTKLSSIPKSRNVASFAEEQAWAKRYFTKINYESYKTRTLNPLKFRTIIGRSFGEQNQDDYIVETKTRPASLEVTEPLPIEVAELIYSSRHPSLAAFRTYVGVVHSLTEVMILSSTVRLTQKGWNTSAPELSEIQWKYRTIPWTDIVKTPDAIWAEAKALGEIDIRNFLESLPPKVEALTEEVKAEGLAAAKENTEIA